MPGKSKIQEQNIDFEKTYRELSDEQLVDVLRKRKYYQNVAVGVAIEEALKRGLIQSENDLYEPEFEVEPLKPRLFPKIENDRNRLKIRKSVARGLFIAGILPIIWGFVRFNAGFGAEGILLVVFGLTWMAFSAWLIRRFSTKAVFILFALEILSMFYAGKLLIFSSQIIFLDVFIVVVLYLFIIYGLLFIRRLK